MKKKNLLMTAIAIFGLATITIAQVPSYVPTNGLVGWWPFNGNANDESINVNNGIVNGAILTTDRNGYANTSYYFDGVDDFIEVPNSISVTLTGDLTMSAWVKTDGSNGQNYQSIISKRETYWTWEYNMILSYHNGIIHDTKLLTSRALGVGNQEQAYTTTPYTTLDWEFWTVVYSSGQVSLYKNGILDQAQAFTLVPNEQICPLLFGRNTLVDNSEQFLGAIDDIGIWNRALSVCEISDLYNSQLGSLNTTASQTVTALDTYTWPINSQTYTQSGTYTAVIPNAAGCDSTITLDLSLDFTGLEENSEGALFSVFPNPAQSTINVKLDIKLIGKVYSIYDNTGRVVLTGKVNSENTTIELGNLSGGIYMFNVGENMKQSFKVIKE